MHLELRSNRALFMSEGKVSTCHIAVPVRGTIHIGIGTLLRR